MATRLDDCLDAIRGVVATLSGREAAGGDLPRVVLVGRPNIGKSSLFNALVGHAAALVADEPGTTRDSVEARVRSDGGRDWLLVDLAGLDDAATATDDPVNTAAQARARAEASRADVVVACRDAGSPEAVAVVAEPRLRIDAITRCDRAAARPFVGPAIATSVVTGAGIADLRLAVDAAVAALPPPTSPTLRMRVAAATAAAAVVEARRAVDEAVRGAAIDEAVVAGSLHAAAESLADATGAALGTDLLDRIFARHCIGK